MNIHKEEHKDSVKLSSDDDVMEANCVVTKDVEPYAVVAGIPAKKVNKRPRDLRYEFTGRAMRLY